MNKETVIEIRNLSKSYSTSPKNRRPSPFFWDYLFSARKNKDTSHQALKNISLDVQKGEILGLIGKNGAGKSTLLKLLSRITKADQGTIKIKGRISAMLEVGTGFHRELTGRENVYLNGAILGMGKAEIASKLNDIIAFAEVDHMIDEPVKHYSTGMYMRLAFSVSIYLDADILLIDEVFAVGDAVFQQKSLDKLNELFHEGRTILLVSHNLTLLQSVCTRIVVIERGELVNQGDPDEMLQYYTQGELGILEKEISLLQVPRSRFQKSALIFGKVMLDKNQYFPADSLEIRFVLESIGNEKFKELNISFGFFDVYGNCVLHFSNVFVNKMVESHRPEQCYSFFISQLGLKPGRYSLNFQLIANSELQDWLQHVLVLDILPGNIYNTHIIPKGMVQIPFDFRIHDSLSG